MVDGYTKQIGGGKTMTDVLKVVGKNLVRSDVYDKAVGAARYTADLPSKGALYGKILRSPFAHARIKNIDIRKAEKLDGVVAIVTYKDVPSALFGELFVEDCHVLPDRARFVGDEVVAVAADAEEIAGKALELIDIEYEELTVVLTPEEALKPGAPLIPPEEWSKSNLLDKPSRTLIRERGNVDEGFGKADCIFQDTYNTTFIAHMPIEPRACLASWDNDELMIYVCTQTPFAYRDTIARILGMPATKVRLISPHTGGSFGGKYHGRYAILAAILAKKAGRPVRIIFTREEETLSKMRPSCAIGLKMGVKKDGTLTAMDGTMTTNGGGYCWALNTAALTTLRGLFRCPNVRYSGRTVYTNHPYTGEWRGVMNGVMTFAVAQLIDTVAEKLGFKDTIELVKKIHIQPGDECSIGWEKEGVMLSNCGLDECLERGAETIGWNEKWKGWKTPVLVNGSKRIGMGVAVSTHHSGNAMFTSSAVVKLNLDGTADFLTPVTSHGQGAPTTQAQILSEASGIPMEDIKVTNADTAITPLDPWGQVASMAAHICGLAAKLAGEDAKRQLLQLAADELKTKADDLEIENGKVYVKGNPQIGTTIRALAGKMQVGFAPVIGRGTTDCPHWPRKARDFSAHFAEVEVDTETGEVKVLTYVAAHDVGRALNPTIVEGQIQGGVLMGLGWTFVEELLFDHYGNPLNANCTDYKIFTSADTPKIIPIVVESNDPLGPYGAKGFGEAPCIPVPGCITNAIYNAIGVRIKALPITPEKVLKALKADGKGK